MKNQKIPFHLQSAFSRGASDFTDGLDAPIEPLAAGKEEREARKAGFDWAKNCKLENHEPK